MKQPRDPKKPHRADETTPLEGKRVMNTLGTGPDEDIGSRPEHPPVHEKTARDQSLSGVGAGIRKGAVADPYRGKRGEAESHGGSSND